MGDPEVDVDVETRDIKGLSEDDLLNPESENFDGEVIDDETHDNTDE